MCTHLCRSGLTAVLSFSIDLFCDDGIQFNEVYRGGETQSECVCVYMHEHTKSFAWVQAIYARSLHCDCFEILPLHFLIWLSSHFVYVAN